MEDVPVDNEDETKKGKKSKKLSFLDSWRRLNRRAETDETTTDSEIKKPFSERTWESFKEFFGAIIKPPQKLNEVEEPPSFEADAFITPVAAVVESKPQVATTETIARDSETTDPEPERAAIAEPLAVQASEDGELWIDHADESSFEPELPIPHPEVEPEVLEFETIPEPERQILAEESTAAASSEPEPIGNIVKRMEKQQEAALTNQKQANRKQTQHLNRQVNKLKQKAKQGEKGQKSLKQEQAEMQAQIDRVMRSTTAESLIARQERERAHLRENRGMVSVPEAPPTEKPKSPVRIERPISAEPEKPASVQVESLPGSSTLERQFETLPQEDNRSERYFERRHEVKDEPGSQSASAYGARASVDNAHRSTGAPTSLVRPPSYVPPQPNSPLLPLKQKPMDSPMYRHAVKNGFMTAVLLLAIWLVIYVS